MQRLRYHWDAPTWRYTLSGWSVLIAEAGFLIRRLDEPRPTEEQVQRNPNLEDCYRLPAFLIFELVKPGTIPNPVIAGEYTRSEARNLPDS